MKTFIKKLIETAREFPNRDDLEITDIANTRAQRAENAPVEMGNNYVREFSHFDENGKPVFKWANWGGV